MFELIIMLCRYLFLFYIFYFLWQSVVYIGAEQKDGWHDMQLAISKQRVATIFMHITAFLILSYRPTEYLFEISVLIAGGIGTFFLLYGYFVSEKVFKESCDLTWNSMFFLIDVGLIMLQRLNKELADKQLIWVILGFNLILLIPLILKFFPPLHKMEKLYMGLSIAFLLLPFVFGQREYGSINWIHIGSINLQPSEVVKLLFILYLSCAFYQKPGIKDLILPGAFSCVLVLILVAQKDLGGALIYFVICMVMVYIATGNTLLFLSGFAGASVASMIAYHFFSHIQVRVMAWQNPLQDMAGGGYQIMQSLFALGTWGVFGSGLTRGYPGYVPVVEKDFIFAAVCEEFGILFGIGIICIFILMLYRGFLIAQKSNNQFHSILASGISGMLAFQAFLILGGVTKFIPMTGVTLPFICYGGSSMLISIAMIGFLQWLSCGIAEDEGLETEEGWDE